ncbi:MAG: DNA adenine methylase [Sulfuricaulis sp.]
MNQSEPRRPILRYHGGKWLLAPWIIQHLPPHRIYVEPFGGGGSVLLRKPRSYGEIYNDLDGEIVNVFRVARDCGKELRNALRLTPFSRVEFEQSYEPHPVEIEQARRTIIRSFMGFGSAAVCGETSGFRANSNRSGTTPAQDWKNYPEAMDALVERLRGVVIENRDASEVMLAHDATDTVHYVDPPYVHSTRSEKIRGTVTRKSYKHEMTDGQHTALADMLHRLRGAVVLSGYPCALYDRLYADWRRVERIAMADGAKKRIEVLWLSPACALKQERLFA